MSPVENQQIIELKVALYGINFFTYLLNRQIRKEKDLKSLGWHFWTISEWVTTALFLPLSRRQEKRWLPAVQNRTGVSWLDALQFLD